MSNLNKLVPPALSLWVTACFCGHVYQGTTVCPNCGRCSLPRERAA